MQERYDLAKELKCEWTSMYSAMAYPGSALHSQFDKKDLPKTNTGYSQHSFDCKPIPTKNLTSEQILEFRDNSFYSIYTDKEYRKFLESKFGRDSIVEMDKVLSIKLKRKILGDKLD